MEYKDYTGFENEFIRVIGLSSPEIQEEKNKKRKNRAEFWDYQCKRCGNFDVVAKPNIPYIHSCGCFTDKKFKNAEAEVGKTYNNLTITRVDYERILSKENKYKHIYVYAICKCGKYGERSYDLSAIKNGHVKSCGCSKFNNPLIMEDLTGKTFGRLTVIRRDIERDKKEIDENGVRSGNAHWLCSCSCGNPKLVSTTGYSLKSGGTKSCGCINSELITARNKDKSIKRNRPEKYKDNAIVINDDDSIRVYDENMEYSFLVDSQDYDFIKQWYWRKDVRGDNPNKMYWVTNSKVEDIKKGEKAVLKLHQIIAQRKYGEEYNPLLVPDHLSRDPDDNRRCNIVQKTNMENSHNRKLSKTNTSGKTGVCQTSNGTWAAYITVNYKTIHLGEFSDFEEAVKIRKKAEQKYKFTCDDVKPDYDLPQKLKE